VTIEEERTTLDGVKDNQRARSSIAGIPGRRRRGAPGQVRGERLSSRITSPEGFVGLDAIVTELLIGAWVTDAVWSRADELNLSSGRRSMGVSSDFPEMFKRQGRS
jgi:hypothetical protein